MENSTPYLDLPLPVQHPTAHKESGSQQMTTSSSPSLLSFLPDFHNADKGNEDIHAFSVATSESVHAEDLHSSFKMSESSNLMFDPFSSEQQLNADVLTVRHDLMDNCKPMNNFSSVSSSMQSGEIGIPLAPSSSCLDTSIVPHQPQEQSISLSSHIFSKTVEDSMSMSSSYHSPLIHVPLESCQSYQDIEPRMAVELDSKHCGKQIDHMGSNNFDRNQTDDKIVDSVQEIVCEICNLKFGSQSDLEEHIKCAHDGKEEKRKEYIFECTLCPKAFKTHEHLVKHEGRHPYKTAAIQCSKCREILGNYILLQEHKQYEDYLSSCDICGQLFPNEECMICHIRNAHNDFEDFLEEECSSSEGHVEPSPALDTTHANSSCLSEEPQTDMYVQTNILSEEPSADEGQVGKEKIDSISQESTLEHSSSSLQEENILYLNPSSEPTVPSESGHGRDSNSENDLDRAPNSDLAVSDCAETAALETDTLCPEEAQESGGEQTVVDDNGSLSEESEPEEMRCRYCSKKCSTRKSLVRHERCHPYESAAMKCNLCLEVVENYKILKIHKKKLAQVSCNICNQLCPNELCLLCHVRNVHNNTVFDAKPIYSVSDDSNDAYNYGEDEDASDDGAPQFSVSRYATRNSGAPLRITIKQEKEDIEGDAGSPAFSVSTPPTPSTPSPRGPPTPSPPSFVPESEVSDLEDGDDNDDDNDDEYEPNASDDSRGPAQGNAKSSRRKSSLRNTRKSSLNSVLFSSSEGSDRDESSDNYSPEESVSEEDSDWGQEEKDSPSESKKRTRRQNPLSDEESDEDPDWRRAASTAGIKRKGRRKKNPLSDDSDDDVGWRPPKKPSVVFKKKARKKKNVLTDDDSDNDPDWGRVDSAPVVVKKKGSGKRGRPKKVQIAFFVPAIPIPKRPRAKGLGGKKAQDAAAALAQAVEDMETTVPELKTVIRPVRRSVTKASLKRYCELEDDEYDYLLDVKKEPKEGVEDLEHVQVSPEEVPESAGRTSYTEPHQGSDPQSLDEGEQIVIKAEPYDFQDDDQSESTDLYFSRKFCETKFENKGKGPRKPVSRDGDEIKREGYGCKLCGRAMQYRSHLIRHLRKVHDGEGIEEVMRRMMHCRFCSKPYTNELSLINHEKLHDGTSKMKCNKCEERFDDKNALRRHQRKTHWEHQPVECEICKKQLSDNTCLKAHMKHMHGSEEKKVTIFTCETCGRQLHTKTAFQNHVASKCGTNLLFPCETCGKSFSFKGSLKAHQLLHTGVKSFLCKFCGKAFHQKGEMKRHERKHTGEKPFICEVCGRAFAYRESLIGHSAVHTGIKPFPCKACGMRFSCSGNLVKHRRSNNCKGFMEHGNNSTEDLGLENCEENLDGGPSVPAGKPTTVVLDGSPESLNSDGVPNDAQLLLNDTQNLHNKIHSKNQDYRRKQEPVQSMITHVQDQSMNQVVGSNISMPISNVVSNAAISLPRDVANISMPVSCSASSVPMSDSRSVSNILMPESRGVNVPISDERNVNNVSMLGPRSAGSSNLMSASMGINNSAMQVPTSSVGSPSMTDVPMTSVIKSAPSINVKPTSALQGVPKESRSSAQGEAPQALGIATSTSNRLPSHLNAMYNNHDNGATVQNNYNSHNLATSYNDNHFRQSNQVNMNDRRFMQLSMDGYTGRTDQYYDRQALMRHEMSRQVMDRSTSRFLDWTGGVQFSGMDSRNSLQSYPPASISHSSGYPNIHSGHLGNYTASHTGGHANNHATVYSSNAMMPGGVGFPGFSANNHIGMSYAPNNPIPAHAVAHSSSYPTSHMSHLEALFGHFSHSGPSNNFPRLSSHNVGSPGNPSLPSNNRV